MLYYYNHSQTLQRTTISERQLPCGTKLYNRTQSFGMQALSTTKHNMQVQHGH